MFILRDSRDSAGDLAADLAAQTGDQTGREHAEHLHRVSDRIWCVDNRGHEVGARDDVFIDGFAILLLNLICLLQVDRSSKIAVQQLAEQIRILDRHVHPLTRTSVGQMGGIPDQRDPLA